MQALKKKSNLLKITNQSKFLNLVNMSYLNVEVGRYRVFRPQSIFAFSLESARSPQMPRPSQNPSGN